MFNYCTLFDLRYLSRGLALYDSLVSVNASFHLYILAMDKGAYDELKRINLPHVTAISLAEFEDPDLIAIKATRTRQEYCWTCTPSIIRYCLRQYDLHECTYLDADVFFFSNPQILHDEFAGKSILITEHRYFPEFDQSATSGRYCVQFITFRNDEYGLKALEWWRTSCNAWCFARHEDGKFGDQKYLDDWTDRFEKVHVTQNHGAGLAPWNLLSYDLFRENEKLRIGHIGSGQQWDVVFYHFHDFYFDNAGAWYHNSGIGGYRIGRDVYQYVYARYLQALYGVRRLFPEKILSDFPAIPHVLSRTELDNILIPSLSDMAEKKALRDAYETTQEGYRLKDGLKEQDREVLFRLLLKAGYKLDQYVYWDQPGNYVREILNGKKSIVLRVLLKIRNKLKKVI